MKQNKNKLTADSWASADSTPMADPALTELKKKIKNKNKIQN